MDSSVNQINISVEYTGCIISPLAALTYATLNIKISKLIIKILFIKNLLTR